MVALYVGGKRVGTWAEAEQLFEQHARTGSVEFRDESGAVIARSQPVEPIVPWDPSLTKEKIDAMIAAGGGMPLAEFWKRKGRA